MSDADALVGVLDTHGLHALATASGNLKAALLTQLKAGKIVVLASVWQEFEDLYEDEAAELASHLPQKVSVKKAYHVGAAAIADKLNSGFPSGPYDDYTDLCTASYASIEGRRIITSAGHLTRYKAMGSKVFDLATWLQECEEKH